MTNEIDIMRELEDDLGELISAQEMCPGVFFVSAKDDDTCIPFEYYVVRRDCDYLSETAKSYGIATEHHPDYLYYEAARPDNGRVVLEYEVNRYLSKHGKPLMFGETLLSIANFGREYNPEYFGDYPAPMLTSKGSTLKYVQLARGVFLIETEILEKVVAICYPIWACDLSEYTKLISEHLPYDEEKGIDQTEGFSFYSENSACVALLELWKDHKDICASGNINLKAMMNAIWKHHPIYAAKHNLSEQMGLHDDFGLFLRSIGQDVELKGSAENMIFFSESDGVDYMTV